MLFFIFVENVFGTDDNIVKSYKIKSESGSVHKGVV